MDKELAGGFLLQDLAHLDSVKQRVRGLEAKTRRLFSERGHNTPLTALELYMFGTTAAIIAYALKEKDLSFPQIAAAAGLWLLPSVGAHFSEPFKSIHRIFSKAEVVQFLMMAGLWGLVSKMAFDYQDPAVGVFSAAFSLGALGAANYLSNHPQE